MPRAPAPRIPGKLGDAAAPVACFIAAVGALLAIKEYVYEPYIAPKMEQWAEEFVAYRRAKHKRQLSLPAPQDMLSPLDGSPGRLANLV